MADSGTVLVPGGREVRATLDAPGGETTACVVACPPHPQYGGFRSDSRLVAVSDALAERDTACLRFDYGEWDEGYGERADARNAVEWARDRYERVGLFGYSFGGGIAILAAAEVGPGALSALAPASRLDEDLDAAAALEHVDCPVQVVYGERDTTASWEPVVDRATERDLGVEAFSADHFFVGQEAKIGALVGDFFASNL